MADLGFYKCPHCKKKYKTAARLEKHIEELHSRNSHTNNLQQHVAATTSVLYPCPSCNRKYKRQEQLIEHRNRVHQTTQSATNSALCDESFSAGINEIHHVVSQPNVEEVTPRFYSCSSCNRKYKRQQNLIDHCQQHHQITQSLIQQSLSMIPQNAHIPIPVTMPPSPSLEDLFAGSPGQQIITQTSAPMLHLNENISDRINIPPSPPSLENLQIDSVPTQMSHTRSIGISEDSISPELSESEYNICIICMDAPSEIAMIPCGHKKFCPNCAHKIKESTKTCPYCRQIITTFIRIFD